MNFSVKLSFKLMVSVLFFAVSMQAFAAENNTCNKSVLGGHDVFPWTVAEPFPWKTIQGVWKVHNNPDMLFQFRANNHNKKDRRLPMQIFSRVNCVEPLYKVIGVISDTEKDVIHFQIEDKLMKLAWFNSANLKLNPYQCGEYVMAASIIASAENKNSNGSSPGGRAEVDLPPEEEEEPSSENFFLKKISNSLEIYCKRKI